MLLKECNRCKQLIQFGSVYCSTCRPIVEAEREARRAESIKASNRRYNKKRDPKYVRFYNSGEWRTLSAKYAQDKQYKCESKGCTAFATEVHHVKPIQTPEGWDRRLDYNNLELQCLDCHNERHERFQRRKKYI
jgi:hypothetical protein